MRTRASQIPNPRCETRKTRIRTQHTRNKNATTFYYKEETKQNNDKKMYLKLMLNKLKVMGNFTFIYTYSALTQKTFSKNFKLTCGPCSPMCEF
jgi:hypothetical protein